jgi:hypothetical protein
MTWVIWSEEQTFEEVAAQLSVSDETEQILVRTFLFTKLESLCVSRGWMTLLARSALARQGFRRAIQLVLTQKKSSARSHAIEFLCASQDPTDVWEVA